MKEYCPPYSPPPYMQRWIARREEIQRKKDRRREQRRQRNLIVRRIMVSLLAWLYDECFAEMIRVELWRLVEFGEIRHVGFRDGEPLFEKV